MLRARISGIGSAVPERILTNSELERMVDTSDEWIVTRSGIKERHIVDDEIASSDLATKAAKRAIEFAGITPSDIDLIIVATVTPDKLFPSTATIVQTNLGISGCPAFDISAACTGFIYGLTVAESFIKSGKYKTILVIGVEILTKFTDWNDRGTCVLFGDGAGAAIVTPTESEEGILGSYLSADGSLGHLLELPAGGSRMPITHDVLDANLHTIKMAGSEVFKSAVKSMDEAADKALEAANIKPEDINWVIPHQANIRIIEGLAKRLNQPMEKVIVTIHKYGNTSSSTIPIALVDAIREKKIKKGDLLLLVAFGGGFTWGGLVIRW